MPTSRSLFPHGGIPSSHPLIHLRFTLNIVDDGQEIPHEKEMQSRWKIAPSMLSTRFIERFNRIYRAEVLNAWVF